MFATLQTRKSSILSFVLLLAGAASSQGETPVKDVGKGVFLLLAEESQSCTDACSNSGFTCSDESLMAGSSYFTSNTLAKTVLDVGGDCKVVKAERHGKPFPLIDARHWCFAASPNKPVTNYDCDYVSTMNHAGRRVCSCFGEEGSTGSPTPSPTRSPTKNAPRTTASPTPSPTKSDPGTSPYIPSGYTLSWRDDFNGPDLDTTNWSRGLVYDQDESQHVVWNPRQGGKRLLNNNYHGYILDEDSYIKDGKLVLANREHNPPIKGTEPEGEFQYSTGWVNSLRKRYYNGSKKGSYLETRATFPEGLKVWPAIWLVSESLIWPPEIDIWEYFGCFFNPKRADEMHFRNIWGEWNKSKQVHNMELVDFHKLYKGELTLGWKWTSQEMTWYINGDEVATKLRGSDIPFEDWPDEDMFLILNNGLMRLIDGDTTQFPNYFELDYIALYETNEKEDFVEPPVNEYVVLLGKAGESCTSACAREGLACSVKSLSEADQYATSTKIAATAAAVGKSCSGGMHAEKDWDVNPQVSGENYCFPTVANRSNQRCDAASTLADKSGKLLGHRICSCETDSTS